MTRKIGILLLLLLGVNILHAQKDMSKDTVAIAEAEVRFDPTPHSMETLQTQDLPFQGLANVSDILERSGVSFIKSYSPSGIATLGMRGLGAEQTSVTWNGLQINSPALGLTDLSLFQAPLQGSLSVSTGLNANDPSAGNIGGQIGIQDQILNDRLLFSQWLHSTGGIQSRLSLTKKAKRWTANLEGSWLRNENSFSYTNPLLSNEKENSRHQLRKNAEIKGGFVFFGSNSNFTKVNFWLGQNERQLAGTLLAPKIDSLSDQFQRVLISHQRFGGKWLKTFKSGMVADQQRFVSDATFDTKTYRWQNDALWRSVGNEKRLFSLQAQHQLEAGFGNGLLENAQRNRVAASAQVLLRPKKDRELLLRLRQERIGTLWSIPQVLINFSQRISHWRLALQLGSNFRAPTINEWYWEQGGDPNLNPERSLHGELKWEWEKDRFHFKQNIYLTAVNDYIRWLPQSDGGTAVSNQDHVFARGLESHFTGHLFTKKHKVDIEMRHDLNAVSEEMGWPISAGQLIHVPLHRATATLSGELNAWSWLYSYQFTGKRWLNDSQSSYMPYFMLNHFGLKREVGIRTMRCVIFAQVSNLLNKQYQVMPWQPMPGRTFQVSITCRIK